MGRVLRGDTLRHALLVLIEDDVVRHDRGKMQLLRSDLMFSETRAPGRDVTLAAGPSGLRMPLPLVGVPDCVLMRSRGLGHAQCRVAARLAKNKAARPVTRPHGPLPRPSPFGWEPAFPT